jgi:small subunit ribosomal protein S15
MAAQSAEWVKMKKEDFEKLVVDLGKSGNSPEKIGLILRDQHGIPKAKVFGRKIGKILKEANIIMNPQEDNLNKKTENLKKHIKTNKHDYSAKKSLTKNAATLKKLRMSK